MNTPSIALAVIAAALVGIGFAYVEHLVRSGFGLLLPAGTAATSRTQSCGMTKVVTKCEMCSSGEDNGNTSLITPCNPVPIKTIGRCRA